jgi:hypothetical protein
VEGVIMDRENFFTVYITGFPVKLPVLRSPPNNPVIGSVYVQERTEYKVQIFTGDGWKELR